MLVVRALFAAIVVFLMHDALACSAAPVFTGSWVEDLDRAESISVIEVNELHYNDEVLDVKFSVLEVLKGDGDVVVDGFRFPYCHGKFGANARSTSMVEFFDGQSGALAIAPDCSLIPLIHEGGRYIYIMAHPVSRYIFVDIDYRKYWDAAVRNYLANGSTTPYSVDEYIEDSHDIAYLSCSYLNDCDAGVKGYLKVKEGEHGNTYYPTYDGKCFDFGRKFHAHRGYDVRGLDDAGMYCVIDFDYYQGRLADFLKFLVVFVR